jgi:hypothetical protein
MAREGAAGRLVPARSISRKLLVLLRDRVGGVWRWREITLPLLALYLMSAKGAEAVALTGAVLLGATALAYVIRPAYVRGTGRRCRERTRVHQRQRRWPNICAGLRWYRKLDNGALLVPALLSWREDATGMTVELRPLPEQLASSWDAMADVFRRFVGGASVEWRESFGTLRIVVGRVGLPVFLPWQPYGGRDGQLVLGRRHGGGLLTLDARTTPHVLLSGATGSGKGGAIRAAAAAALQGGWNVVVLDPKEAGEFMWLAELDVPVVTDLRQQVDALEYLEAVRRARQVTVKQHGADSWLDLPAEKLETWRPVLLIIDEAADILATTKGKGSEDKLRAAFQLRAGELIAELARKGRSAGVHLLVAIQRAETAQLGDQGGALRNNLGARLALGSLDADGLRMLGIAANDPTALALDGTPGRGICVGFASDPRPSVSQVAWLDQTRARAEVVPTCAQGFEVIAPAPGPKASP